MPSRADKEEEVAEEEEVPKSLYVSPIANPIITDKLLDRACKLLKKAVSEKKTKRGVPECTKALRKGMKGICFLAGDIFPMDVFAHVPIFCEEKGVYYCYVGSRHVLGGACQTKRPVSLVMVQEPPADSTYSKTYEQVLAGIKTVHPYM
uniref:H/ACA ribonucleoprotein complex subunit 2 n=1 Tax=Alexandrium catenella TaxID=2925 RepID=A0A7S1SEW4_ALECA|mmetsp:Transcript_98463/g.261644  ORF Transcript_98463/g.261644 Transcript_98463/m.261644 type:complete len:149 (+) Transcript_98463:95-541(+)